MLIQHHKWWIKLINVRPRQRTSNQYHAHRAEFHWRADRPWRWQRVERNRLHRLTEGWYVELAWGFPLEADIVRLSDDYGRTGWEKSL